MKPTEITWICPHCERDTTVTVHPYVPARVSGPPEHCYPAEGGEIEPAFCSHCDAVIDAGSVHEIVSEQERDALAARADEECARRRDEPDPEREAFERADELADRRRDEGR
jgi:hypothetical protein